MLNHCSASVTTWTTQLNTVESRANEHDGYANDLITKVAEPIKVLSSRFEELRKRHAEYAEKLEKERESSYGELRKTKAKYDSVCQDVESKRKKSESSFDKAKAQSAYQQQIIEMNNSKNSYLIAINVTNKQKEMYYHEYLPEVMDSLQDLNEFRVLKLNGLWTLASQLEAGMLESSGGLIANQTQEIARNEPHLDSMMYIQHNMGTFTEPADKVFEPSPVWHDEPTMVVDEPAKIYLRNVLNKSKSQLGELRRDVDKKRREVDSAKQVKLRVRQGKENKDEVAVVAAIFALQEDLHALDRKKVTAEVETSTITSVVGDVTLGAKNHNFKSQTFKIPTNCDLCGERIWGLSAKGFDCRDCGYTCHSKCEMKVPAECPGESSKDERKKLKQQRQEAANALLKPSLSSTGEVAELPAPPLSRSNTTSSSTTGYAASAHRSMTSVMSPTEETPPEIPSATRPVSTIGAAAGSAVRKHRVIAPPPAAYISELPGSAPANGSSGGGQKGKMLYSFEANGDGEISVAEGREVAILEPDSKFSLPVSSGPLGVIKEMLKQILKTAGSGWVKVRAGYKEGLVPATYLEHLPLAAQHTGASSIRPASTYSNSGSSIGGGTKKKGPAVAPRRGAKKLRYVEALYEYTAQSEAEHSMTEGERFVLVKEDQGDGWAEVEKGGVTASVPASYVQVV